MRQALRGTVMYTPTEDGMLFWYGDAFVQVKGQAAWEWYQRIRPALEDRLLPEEEYRALLDRDGQLLERFCERLKSGDMLYDASEDDPSSVPLAVQARYEPQIWKIEKSSMSPIKVFGAISAKPVLILAPPEIGLAMLDAALESGLRNIFILFPDGTFEAKDINEASARHSAGSLSPSVKVLSNDECRKLLKTGSSWEYVVVGGLVGRDWQSRRDQLTALWDGHPAAILGLCIGASRVVAGIIEPAGNGGCDACLEKYCTQFSSWDRACAPPERNDITLGSRLVIQYLWDMATDPHPEDLRQTILELDRETYTVRWSPRPAGLKCARCRAPRTIMGSESWPFIEDSRHEFDASEFCARAQRLCVDARSGLILSLDEGDLPQYPCHQCAAFLGGPGTSALWVTESGEDMQSAKLNTIRTALEFNCERVLTEHPRSMSSVPVYLASLQFVGKWDLRALPPGLVVSALRPHELVHEALYRALAQHTRSEAWLPTANLAAAESIGPEGDLIAAHLNDTGALQSVVVHQYPANGIDCFVLRFSYCDKPVTVVAGSDAKRAWTRGLQDVWMHVTACEILPDYDATRTMRFRSSYTPTAESLSRMVNSLEKAMGLRLWLIPLVNQGALTLAPLFFAYAFISGANAVSGTT
jgi:hypothetical protein